VTAKYKLRIYLRNPLSQRESARVREKLVLENKWLDISSTNIEIV
jgi:hypothetical protein